MELWIRSQNKGALIKVEMLGNIDGIIYSYLGVNKTELGKYSSGERALEVLDEIFEMLKGTDIINLMNKTKGNINNVFPIMTYEMPKE